MDFPEALAGVLKTIRMARRMIEEEMNSATDNPLVYYKQEGVEKAELVSAGNFHGEYVAKAADFLGFALFDLAKFSEARIQKYINGKVSRLPPYLIKNGGLNSGLMILQCNSHLTQTPRQVCCPKAKSSSSQPPRTRSSPQLVRRTTCQWEGSLPESAVCYVPMCPTSWASSC